MNKSTFFLAKPIFFLFMMAFLGCQKDEEYADRVPEVFTGSFENIEGTTVGVGGSFITGSKTVVSSYGLCYRVNQNPTISDSISKGNQILVTLKGNRREETFICKITGLKSNTTYYFKAFALNSAGTGYGEEVSFLTPPLKVGQKYGGGIIFYIDYTGEHGLIASTQDQSNNSQWFNGVTYIRTGATGCSIGEGNSNTNLIVNKQGEGIYAAAYCYNLELNGYNDWFLPSKDELNIMYGQKDVIGGFSNDFYWSSTEYGEGSAWEQVFNSGTQYFVNKNFPIHVRAIRVF